ncbi:MAG: excisionase family DNA-binding protein [Phycisphaerae bacterium]|nr:excisionase family DNA-binding protein [Phycisphaerae bacterium]
MRVSKRTVWRLLRRGCLRRVRTGRAVRIRHADLEKFISVGGGA